MGKTYGSLEREELNIEHKIMIAELLINELRYSNVSIGSRAPDIVSIHFKTEISNSKRQKTFDFLRELTSEKKSRFEVYVMERLIAQV